MEHRWISAPHYRSVLVRRAFFAGCLGCAASVAFATESVETPETITIHGDAVPADDVDVLNQAGFITVIDMKDVSLAASTVSEVLAAEAGIQVRDMGGLGAFSSVYLRGASSQHVNVYLDGILLNDLASGTVDLSRISVNQVDQIEIYRGSPPIQFGQSAIGGAINIRSKASARATTGEVVLGYGSFETQKISASGTWAVTPALSVNGSLGYQASDNDFEFLFDNRTPLNPRDDVVQKRQNNEVDMSNGLLGARYRLSDRYFVQFKGQHHRKHQSLPDLFNSPLTDSALDLEMSQLQWQLNDSAWRQGSYTANVFWGGEKLHYFDRQGRIGFGTQDDVSTSRTHGIEWTAVQNLSPHQITLQWEWKKEQFRNRQNLHETPEQKFNRQTLSAGVQDDWTLFDQAWAWQGAMRVQSIWDDGAQPVEGGYQQVDEQEAFVTAQLGTRYDVLPEMAIKSNLSRAVRIPRLSEKFGDRGLFIGNEELTEETAINLDVGAQWHFADGQASMAFFQRWLSDAIVATYDSRGVGQYQNISEAEVSGIELSADWQLLPWMGLGLRSTVQHTENTSNISDQKGKQLAGHYAQAHALRASADYAQFGVLAEYQLERGGYYDSAESTAIPAKKLLNVGLTWQPPGISGALEFSVRNALDNAYEAFNGYPSPGRHYFVAWRQTFNPQ